MLLGLGITTFRRPEFLEVAVASVEEFLGNQLSLKIIHDDASPMDPKTSSDLQEKGWEVILSEENVGVARSKNRLLHRMMEAGCGAMFLMEDDMEVLSSQLLQKYLEAMDVTGLHHLNFAHHGTANVGPAVVRDDLVAGWPNCVGAFSVYSRNAIDTVGYLDEGFKNDLDHVNHTYRLTMANKTSPWGVFADVVDSQLLIKEQSGAIASSTIGHQDLFEPGSPFQESLHHWYRTWPMPASLLRLLR